MPRVMNFQYADVVMTVLGGLPPLQLRAVQLPSMAFAAMRGTAPYAECGRCGTRRAHSVRRDAVGQNVGFDFDDRQCVSLKGQCAATRWNSYLYGVARDERVKVRQAHQGSRCLRR